MPNETLIIIGECSALPVNLYCAMAASPMNTSINVEKHSAIHCAKYCCKSFALDTDVLFMFVLTKPLFCVEEIIQRI